MIRHAEAMAGPLELVIANHIETRTPILLEGDFLLPSLATQSHYNGISANGQVRGVVIYEQDEDQIAANYQCREGEPQRERAHTSWRYSEWLRTEAYRLGVPVVAARPWETVLERTVAAVNPTP